jgi:hypothetical protein
LVEVTAIKFERVNAIPDDPVPGTVYFVKRPDGELDTYVVSSDGDAILQRSGHVQMHVDSLPADAQIPADQEIGRYYAAEALELIEALSGWRCEITPTNESVFPVKIGAETIATVTFQPGEPEAVIDVIDPAVAARSIVSFRTPVATDPTLAGVVGTFVARRT